MNGHGAHTSEWTFKHILPSVPHFSEKRASADTRKTDSHWLKFQAHRDGVLAQRSAAGHGARGSIGAG